MLKTSLGLQIEDFGLSIAGRGESANLSWSATPGRTKRALPTPADTRLQSRPGFATLAPVQNG